MQKKTTHHCHLPLGARLLKKGTEFKVWAPHAEYVSVIGTFNSWDKSAHPLKRTKEGVWQGTVDSAKLGDEYKVVIRNGSKEFTRIDPYAVHVTYSVGNAIISDIFSEPGPSFTPPPLNELVIYEMHIGTFNDFPGGEPGTLDKAIEKLPHLKELGVNAIELMPVMEFAGSFSWGYNPSLIFAIETSYGGPQEFKKFVRAAHESGLAVIIDVVYNHLGPGDLDLWQFDGWHENDKGGIYFYNDWRSHTPWGDTRPDYGRDKVRSYLYDNAMMWLKCYGVDGLRWDMTAFIRNVEGRDDHPDQDLPDGWSLMQWINSECGKKGDKILIAEDMQSNPALTESADKGGAGFHSQWDATFVHTLREQLIIPNDKDRDLYKIRNVLQDRFNSDPFQRTIYTESHDEIANGKARLPEEITPGEADSWYAKKRSTLGAALVFTAPGIPMLFQGQEILEDEWFRDIDPIDWTKKSRFKGIFKLYQDLIRLRLNRDNTSKGLSGSNIDVFHLNPQDKILAYHRWHDGGKNDSVIMVLNFADKNWSDYRIGFPVAGRWELRFNSDWKGYDDSFGNGQTLDVTASEPAMDGLEASGSFSIASYSALIFTLT